MTETFRVGGWKMLSAAGGAVAGVARGVASGVPGPVAVAGLGSCPAGGAGEAGLIDHLIDLVLALEPLELKQHDTEADPDGAVPAPQPGGVTAPTLVAESTQRMLAQMRAVLDREAARLGADGVEGKPAVDQVALIARTLEKIDQMERLIAGDRVRASQQNLSAGEREQLRQTVRQLILAAAERLAAERGREA
ncbi:hypothetical protein SAMN05877838_2375 [Hoeflea halophila]|uniref:Uncharacterized protein n=1 Tax=Hoeflea halophila TaxID=714899 RepID=A0A286ICU6_9HYPH|nr:hypothetical protein [Hoeflea halophila]SOE17476.1 hypothetical protein SAMN05877838_2375 [Hoeflea halophila]